MALLFLKGRRVSMAVRGFAAATLIDGHICVRPCVRFFAFATV